LAVELASATQGISLAPTSSQVLEGCMETHDQFRDRLRPFVPQPVIAARRAVIKGVRRARAEWPLVSLQLGRLGTLDYRRRSVLVKRLLDAHAHVPCAHTHQEMVRIARAIFAIPDDRAGCIVEAGCFKGGSTAKLSIVASEVGRKLVVFDSFEGMPENDEPHETTIFGDEARFAKGSYAGRLSEVSDNVERWGELSACEMVPGWFDDTMPSFHRQIAVGFIDVDLASSTRTCLEHLYPCLIPGGVLFSHDGHLPLCIEVLRDRAMWERIGGPPPIMTGLGTDKLVAIQKPPQ
jgi:O-methyltransferase